MEKVLSISIAAYNSAKYIEKTLDSCLNEEIINDIEIFVIDDGGTDSTLAIAKKYAEKYPDTIIPVHKENGGYGSTVNYAIKHARGKYFRLLDGDDWFEKSNLPQYIEYLKSCTDDMVLTRMCYEYLSSGKSELSQDKWLCFAEKKTVSLDCFLPGTYAGMWEIAYKTAILKNHPICLPEHTMYTDHIYIMKPIPFIDTVSCLNMVIYHYRLESEGQSVAPESRIKHSEEIIQVSEIINRYFEDNCKTKNKDYALERARRCYMEAFRTQLLKKKSKLTFERIKEMDLKLKNTSEELYKEAVSDSKRLKFYRLTWYWGYFLK